MSDEKSGGLKKIIVGILITIIVGGSSPWWWNKYIDPPDDPPEDPPTEQVVYRKGNKTLRIEGVLIRPPAANTSDSFIFKGIDLETGKLTTSINADVNLQINVHKLRVNMRLKEGVLVGQTEATYLKCKELLAANNGKNLVVDNKRAPTNFYCTETKNGRISQFQIKSIKSYKTPEKDFYTIVMEIKYKTWKL